MQRSSAKRRVASAAPIAAIALATPKAAEETGRAARILVVFMRVVAALWMVEGVLQWSAILSSTGDGQSAIVGFAPLAMIATFFFAVMDFVAAVGLWLAAAWGGVLWFVAAGAQLLVVVVMPGFFLHPVLTALLDLVLIAAYIGLVWLAAHDIANDI